MGIRADELLTAVHPFGVAAHTGDTLLPLTLCTASLRTATPWLAAEGGRWKGGLSFLHRLQSMDRHPSAMIPLPTVRTSVGEEFSHRHT